MLGADGKLDPSKKPNSATGLFKFLSPGGGEIFETGSNIQIIWEGGPAVPQKVQISLINLRLWQVVKSIPVAPQYDKLPGVVTFKIPADLFSGVNNNMTPIDGFQIYISDEAPTTWRYSETFMIWCGAGSYYPVAKPFEGVYPLPAGS